MNLLGILMVLSGLSTKLVDVSVPLPYQALVVVRRVHLVDNRRIIDRDADDLLLVSVQDRSRALPRCVRALEQLTKQAGSPNHRMTTAVPKRRDHHRRARTAVRL